MTSPVEPSLLSDTPIWDAWLAPYQMPSLAAADELRVFEALSEQPSTAEELAARLGLYSEAVKALLPLLTALGFLEVRLGRHQLTAVARVYLLHDSPRYWGHAFSVHREQPYTKAALRGLRGAGAALERSGPTPADSWASGKVSMPLAEGIAAFMNSHSVPAAEGVARSGQFAGVRRLLDVGGGSGCFSIALAQQLAGLSCTVMELDTMCIVAGRYITAAGVEGRVDTRTVDMFREPWPTGYDAIFMSNIFHDWRPETNAELAAKSFDVLPSGGRIYLHEMLIDDDGSGPLAAAAFSMMMVISTRGRQYSLAELKGTLEDAGFQGVEGRSTYGHYSLVQATKP